MFPPFLGQEPFGNDCFEGVKSNSKDKHFLTQEHWYPLQHLADGLRSIFNLRSIGIPYSCKDLGVDSPERPAEASSLPVSVAV